MHSKWTKYYDERRLVGHDYTLSNSHISSFISTISISLQSQAGVPNIIRPTMWLLEMMSPTPLGYETVYRRPGIL